MATEIKYNKNIHQEVIDLQAASAQRMALKSLFALVLLVTGVAAIILLNVNFLPYGIGMVVLAAVAMHQYVTHYRNSSVIYSRAAKALQTF